MKITYLVALALAWSGLASAATLISVTGPVSNTSPTSTGSAAWAQAFTLAQNHTGVAIGAPTVCQGCTGFVFLTNDVGAAASLANVFNSDNYTGQSTLFSGLTLGPGDYFLVISITAGGFGWQASDAPVFFESNGANARLSLHATTVASPGYKSTFAAFRPDFLYTVTADAVPEPATWLLTASILAGLGLRARRQVL